MIISIKAGIGKNHNKLFRLVAKVRSLVATPEIKDYRQTPVIINNFNRQEYLKLLIEWLEKAGMKNIYIIDNHSTFPPLLKYYQKSKHIIFRLNQDVGYMALWQTHIFMYFKNRPYIYTDPDILPVEECPLNAVEHFHKVLQEHPEVGKVGFGLKIDDLPDHYPLKKKVAAWEKQFWEKPLGNELYDAMIDTTFALYRPNKWGDAGMLKAIRTGGKYMARHLPWYIDPENLNEEETYYLKHSNHISTWYAEMRGEKTNY